MRAKSSKRDGPPPGSQRSRDARPGPGWSGDAGNTGQGPRLLVRVGDGPGDLLGAVVIAGGSHRPGHVGQGLRLAAPNGAGRAACSASAASFRARS